MEQNEPGSSAQDEATASNQSDLPDDAELDQSERARHDHDPYAVLRNHDFQRFLLAGMMATVGNQMQGVAVAWELYERTNSAFALGMVGLAQVLPVLLLAIPSGHAADRYDRQKQMILAQVALLSSAIGLAILSKYQGPVSLTYGLLVLIGIGQALYRPARWAILPQLINRSEIMSAVTWSTSSWQIATMAGPAIGGLALAVTGSATACYILNAACSAVVIILIASLRPRTDPRDSQPVTLHSLLAGLRFVLGTDLILATITLDLLAVFLGGATALLPIFAKDILAIGPSGLGWLRAAPSIGAFMMALILAHRPPMRTAGPTLLWAVSGFGVATIIFGLSRNAYLSFAMLFLSGALDNISIVVRQTLMQMLTPDEMRGRVSAINTIFVASSNELGEFESGVAAGLFGTIAAVVGGGVGTLIVVLAVIKIWPNLQRLGSLHDLKTSQL